MPRVFYGARDIQGSCIMRKKFNFLLLRDRSFFMREGGQPKKNEGKGGGGADEKFRLKIG